MDPLTAFLNGAAPADTTAAPAASSDASAHWRRELERAQWALKPAARPATAQPRAASPTAPEASSRAAARGPHPDASQRQVPPGNITRTDGTTTNRAAASSPLRDFFSIEKQPAAFIGIAQAAPRPQDGAAAQRQAAGAPRSPRVVWPRVNLHAMVRDGAADVWVRDASLERGGRRRLAAELGERLRAAGLRPGALYLNGEEITFNGEDTTSD